jgi:3-oxoacyl-[acyl-carrier protein] reductase
MKSTNRSVDNLSAVPTPDPPLAGQVALVTGAARGIGEAIARRLAAAGASVCVADLDAGGAAAAAAGLPGSAIGIGLDVTRLDSFEAAAAETAGRLGGLTILVNNAGVTRPAMLHKMSEEAWDFVNDVVLRGSFNGFHAVAPWFRADRRARRVVNISSIAGLYGSVGGANYAAAKAGVVGLTRAMAREWAGFGVTVNAVAPGFIETRLTAERSADAPLGLPAGIREDIIARTPVGRAGVPEDVAAAVAYFCSPEAGFVTGQVLEVHGGLVELTPPGQPRQL